ncbi:MAG: TraX family protein [Candidatus Flemingibacterium sp.]|nr:TraX family protein [Candidatus Flemingibacterium sp.]
MTSAILKLIALIAMTLDHTTKIIGQRDLIILFPNVPLSSTAFILDTMECIGRLAFPVFAFLVVEGVVMTRSLPRYLGRLALFTIISEPFYYFAFTPEATAAGLLRHFTRLRFTSVFATFTLSVLMIMLFRLAETKLRRKAPLVYVPVTVAGLLFAEITHCDYGAFGVLLVISLYLAGSRGQKTAIICVWSILLYIVRQIYDGFSFHLSYLSVWSVLYCLAAMSSAVLLWLYNGKRGRQSKWLFYIYYPAHLFVLKLVGILIRKKA